MAERPTTAASVERFCVHDGCFRLAQEATGYCCDACNDADGDGLPPEHEKGCRRGVTLRPEDLRPIKELMAERGLPERDQAASLASDGRCHWYVSSHLNAEGSTTDWQQCARKRGHPVPHMLDHEIAELIAERQATRSSLAGEQS